MSEPRNVPLAEIKERLMQSPEFQAEYKASEPAYQLARLRIQQGLTQKDLADLLGTHQSSIARFESGSRGPNWEFMQQIADALGFRIELHFVPKNE